MHYVFRLKHDKQSEPRRDDRALKKYIYIHCSFLFTDIEGDELDLVSEFLYQSAISR